MEQEDRVKRGKRERERREKNRFEVEALCSALVLLILQEKEHVSEVSPRQKKKADREDI